MRWVHRFLGLVFAALCTFPVLTLVAEICGVPLASAYLLALPGLVVASVLSAAFPRRYRIIGVIVLVLLDAAVAMYLYPTGWLSPFVALAMALAHIFTLGFSAEFDQNPVTVKEFGFGAALYGVSYALMFLHGDHAHLPMLGIACVAYLIYSVILINLNSVNDAGQVARRVEARLPSTLRAGNILLTLVFIGVALVLVNIGLIKDLFMAAAGNILLFLLWLASLGAGEESGAGGGDGGGLQDMLGGDEKNMAPWLEAILNVVLYVVTALVLIALLALLCVAVYRGVKKLIAMIRKWLMEQGRDVMGDMGYTDERTKLTHWDSAQTEEKKKGWLEKLLFRLPKWSDLNNRERMRFALQQMMYPERKSEADRTRTAREIVEGVSFLRKGSGDTGRFVDAYNRARYSDDEISDADAENARKFLRGER